MSETEADRVHATLMASLHSGATRAVSRPESEREAYLGQRREVMYEILLKSGRSEAEARRFADRMDEWVRALVKIIITRGGATPGNA
jgi:hypothetical protein